MLGLDLRERGNGGLYFFFFFVGLEEENSSIFVVYFFFWYVRIYRDLIALFSILVYLLKIEDYFFFLEFSNIKN